MEDNSIIEGVQKFLEEGQTDNFFKFENGEETYFYLIDFEKKTYFYNQHWVDNKKFVCLGDNCPGCKNGDNPTQRFAVNIVQLIDGPEGVAYVNKILDGPAKSLFWKILASVKQTNSKGQFVMRRTKTPDGFYQFDCNPCGDVKMEGFDLKKHEQEAFNIKELINSKKDFDGLRLATKII